MEFQLSYLKSDKMMQLNCSTHYASKFGKLSSGHRTDWKRSLFIPIPKKGNAKEHSNYHTIALISHTSNLRDSGLIPELERSSGEGNGNPLQYSCLENPMDGRVW